MLAASIKKDPIDKQEIINYQYQILQQSTPQVKPTISNTHKYSPWDLDAKIKDVIGDQPAIVRWIGNSPTAYLETYSFLLLIGSGHSETNIIELKSVIYQLGRQCLDLHQQKLLVEFLCLIQYSRDRYSFLSKYPQIQTIFIKILQSLEQEQPRSSESSPDSKNKAKVKRKTSSRKQLSSHDSGNFSSQQLQFQLQLQEVYQSFNNYFQFISILGSNQYCCTLQLFYEQTIYVIIENDCYFVVEPSKINTNNSSMANTEQNKMLSDFERIMNSQRSAEPEIQYLQVKRRKDQYNVQESNVIAIDSASQIRQNQMAKERSTTPKFLYFGETHPKDYLQSFQIPLSEDKNDRTFIDQLLTKTIRQSPQERNTERDHSKGKKGKLKEKMKQIQLLKEGLQNVRQRIQNKIKVIDQVEQFKTEVILKMERQQSQRLESKQIKQQQTKQTKPPNQFKEYITKYKQFSPFSKKQRKISYHQTINQPKPTKDRKYTLNELPCSQHQLTQEKESQPYPARHSLKLKPVIFESMASQNEQSKSVTKIAQLPSIQDTMNLQAKTNIITVNKQSKDTPRPSSNVNVNVNVNINDHLFTPILQPSRSSYTKLHKEIQAKHSPIQTKTSNPLFPRRKSPQTKNTTPPKPGKINNPERSLSVNYSKNNIHQNKRFADI